ncbi:integrase, partial [Escherichia coli]|nr:integrase [Escherichia coli]
CPLTDLGGKTSIFSHPVYLFLREFSLQDFRGGSQRSSLRKNTGATREGCALSLLAGCSLQNDN